MSEFNWLISCLIIASLLPYAAKVPLAWAMKKQGSGRDFGYNNEEPRSQQKLLTGFGARCLAAHENSFEALILFAAAITLTITTENVNQEASLLATIFIISRVLYLFFYWINLDKIRSTVWFVGIVCSIMLMINCLQ